MKRRRPKARKNWRDFLTDDQRALIEQYEHMRDELRRLRPEYRRVMQNAMHREQYETMGRPR